MREDLISRREVLDAAVRESYEFSGKISKEDRSVYMYIYT
jgi:hypothetical protein